MVVNKLAILAHFSDIEVFQIELPIVELVNNIIRHTYNNENGHDVEVIFNLHFDRVIFEICETGRMVDRGLLPKKGEPFPQFDPDDISQIYLKEGRGLYIINRIIDCVTYEMSHGRNKLILTKYCGAHEATQ